MGRDSGHAHRVYPRTAVSAPLEVPPLGGSAPKGVGDVGLYVYVVCSR